MKNKVKTLIRTKETTKESYIKFVFRGKSHKRVNFSNDIVIERLRDLFDLQGMGSDWIIYSIERSDNPGACGDMLEIKKQNGSVVTREMQWWCPEGVKSEDTEIIFDKKVLLQLAKDWDRLVRERSPEIFIARKPDGTLVVADTLPKGCE